MRRFSHSSLKHRGFYVLIMTRWEAEHAKFRGTVTRRVVYACCLFIITMTTVPQTRMYSIRTEHTLNQPNRPENEM